MTSPSARPVARDQQRLLVAHQQLDRLAHRVVGRHRRERRLHHLDDLGVEHRRVLGGALEQAALTDRADDGGRIVRAHHRQLRDPMLVQQRDGVAHLVVGLRP